MVYKYESFIKLLLGPLIFSFLFEIRVLNLAQDGSEVTMQFSLGLELVVHHPHAEITGVCYHPQIDLMKEVDDWSVLHRGQMQCRIFRLRAELL